LLWGLFLVSLGAAALINMMEFKYPNLVRYAPPLMLVLAFAAGIAERIVRTRNGLPTAASWWRKSKQDD
jgi:hypothetical protein